MLRYIITTQLAKLRWSIGWSLYHELDLPIDQVRSIIVSAGAEPWHYGAVQDRRRRGEVKAAMEWIVKHVAKDELIFEVGCGCGANLIWLAQHGYSNLTGTDNNPSAIAAAVQLAALAQQPITFRVAEGFIPSDSNISVLLALNSIYYAPIDMTHYLTSCRNRLARHGHIVFDMVDRTFDQMPNNQYLTDDWHRPENQRRPTQYVARLSPAELSRCADAAGFKVAGDSPPTTRRPPRYLAVLALLLTAQVALPPPDEATKNRALRIAYVLNGEQMVREPGLGSIDVSGLLFVVDSSLIETPKPLAKGAE